MRGVVFDLGGTLTARVRLSQQAMEAANAQALARWLRGRRFEVNDRFVTALVAERQAKFRKRAGGLQEIRAAAALVPVLERFGLPADEEFVSAAEAAFFEPELQEMRLLPGAMELLDTLHRRGVRTALASNASSHYFIVECCRRLGLDRFLEPILSSAAVGWVKPHPRIFEAILTTWKIEPADAVIVGDTVDADIAGARRLGMRSILVTGEHAPGDPSLSDIVRPDGVAIDLSTVETILAAWMA